jgi:hypothetical protein
MVPDNTLTKEDEFTVAYDNDIGQKNLRQCTNKNLLNKKTCVNDNI